VASPASRSGPRIGILCPPAGNGNLGDEATVAAVIQNLESRCPAARICCFSSNPEDTARRHQTPSLPASRAARGRSPVVAATAPSKPEVTQAAASGKGGGKLKAWLKRAPFLHSILKRWRSARRTAWEVLGEIPFLAYVFKQSMRLDLLVVAGSGQLCDHFGGPWNFPYTIFKWCLAARCAGARVAFLSIGAGPLGTRLSRFFVKRALSLATYRSFRDETSKALVAQLGVPIETPVHPDLAYSIRLPARSPIEKPKGITVGLNPFPHFDSRYWPAADRAAYEGYVSVMASFASWLLDRGYFIFFFPTQVRADPPVIADIEELLRSRGSAGVEDRMLRIPVSDLGELVSHMAIADFILATRFHALVFAFLLAKPVLAIANHHKMSDLMSAMGQSDYMLDVRTVNLGALIERFQSLEANVDLARSRVCRAVSETLPLLERQYDEILRLKTPE
jgi:polysaccharide pyruvyl transferase WcaK-like protein